jgi:hypothetical protein
LSLIFSSSRSAICQLTNKAVFLFVKVLGTL